VLSNFGLQGAGYKYAYLLILLTYANNKPNISLIELVRVFDQASQPFLLQAENYNMITL